MHCFQKLLKCIIIYAAFGLSTSLPAMILPVDLRTEGQVNPLATPASPNLTWRLEAVKESRGLLQSAWRVQVASSADLLEQGKPDLWDSGKVQAKRSPKVRYAGKAPAAGQVCYWKVRSWDMDDKASEWSEVATWEVALISPSDWKGAQWIDDGKDNPTKDEDFYKPDPAPLMRREFTLKKPVAKARLHVAGLGLCYPSINGERLVDNVFDPQWTNFDKRILYRTHDVTSQLMQGANCLGLALGNGWYNPLPMKMWGRRNLREALPVGRPRAIACLIVDYTDGTQEVVKTGPEWLTTEGPTLRNNIYLGEVRDARKALPGWNKPGYDVNDWQKVRLADYPLETLIPLVAPPVRLGEAFPAVAITEPQSGVYIVDFGRNFTGLPEIDFNLPAGTKVNLRFGELLYSDGTLNTMSSVCGQIKPKELEDGTIVENVGGPGAPKIAWQADTYITRGGGETYRPDFTFHSFQYMEITGLTEAPELDDFRAYTMRSDLQTKGQFTSSNELLNRIQEVCRNTFLANVVTVQSDCPHRERFAYGGDIVATSEAYLLNFDMEGFYRKTVRDWADAVLPDGRFTDTAPFVGVDYCGVGWAKTHPLLLEQLHRHYGAEDFIEAQLTAALGWLDAEAARREDGLVVTGLGDHEALSESEWGAKLTTPLFVFASRQVAQLAKLVGRDEDAARAQSYADESQAAWAAEFLDAETGKVDNGSQSKQAFALEFADTPPEMERKLFEQLVEALNAPEDSPRLSTGIYGTRILMNELSKRGRSDLAFQLATRESYPSWGYMLKNGATTLWETWEGGNDRMSFNHPMFGSISAWFFKWLGGIQPAKDAIGFDRIVIRPQVVGDLKWVKSSHKSIRGTIISNWSRDAKSTTYEITIPPNTTATIELAAPSGSRVTEVGKPLNQVEGIKVLPLEKVDTVRMKALSGQYRFMVMN